MRRIVLLTIVFIFSVSSWAQVDDPSSDDDWWEGRVFYEIFVRSFYDSDGDGIGDFQGLIQKLDYLNDGDPNTTDDLGITGIWLMPINPSPSYHGYDVTDYRAINPDYGTMADFEAFLQAAHDRGIAVIMDMVLNHTSVEHEWFVQSRARVPTYADWYVWADEDPGFRGPENQVVWHRAGGRYYYGVFWSGMPDLNYNNPDVTAEMYDVSRFWLEEIGVDGFRLDAIKFVVEDGRILENSPLNREWLRAYHEYVQSVQPDTLLVGEVWTSSAQAAPYAGDMVDIVFEFDTAEAIIQGASFGIKSPIVNQLELVLELYPPGQYAPFLTNHDQNRVMNQLSGNLDAAKAAASVYLMLPGTPFIYYGEEIGMTGTKPDEYIRTPMQWDSQQPNAGFTTGTPWIRLNADYADGITVADQADDPNSLLNHYRALIHARNATPALQTGNLVLLDNASGNVLSFLRQTDEQTVLVIINLRNREIDNYGITLPEGYTQASLLFGGDGEQIAAPTSGERAYQPLDVLPGLEVLVIELR